LTTRMKNRSNSNLDVEAFPALEAVEAAVVGDRTARKRRLRLMGCGYSAHPDVEVIVAVLGQEKRTLWTWTSEWRPRTRDPGNIPILLHKA
jgi:hypothetical protein